MALGCASSIANIPDTKDGTLYKFLVCSHKTYYGIQKHITDSKRKGISILFFHCSPEQFFHWEKYWVMSICF